MTSTSFSASSTLSTIAKLARGIAAEHAPAPRQLHLLDRAAIDSEILADLDQIAVQRTGADAAERKERIGPAADVGRHLLHAQEIGPLRQLAQCRDQRAADGPRAGGVGGRGDAEQRRVIIGQLEIGEFDAANAALHVMDQRHQRDLGVGRRIGDDRDQRRYCVERAVPRIEPQAVLEARAAKAAVPARLRNRPITDKFDAVGGCSGERPPVYLPNFQHHHINQLPSACSKSNVSRSSLSQSDCPVATGSRRPDMKRQTELSTAIWQDRCRAQRNPFTQIRCPAGKANTADLSAPGATLSHEATNFRMECTPQRTCCAR